jgi:hypothetical protein
MGKVNGKKWLQRANTDQSLGEPVIAQDREEEA